MHTRGNFEESAVLRRRLRCKKGTPYFSPVIAVPERKLGHDQFTRFYFRRGRIEVRVMTRRILHRDGGNMTERKGRSVSRRQTVHRAPQVEMCYARTCEIKYFFHREIGERAGAFQ